MSNVSRTLVSSILAVSVLTGSAAAQSLGVFQWQQLPYCNVLTVEVVQGGSVYRIDGTDNQCGAARSASVTGLGFPNANGTIGLGLTIVTNDGAGAGGAPLHLDVTLALPSASGTWRDNTGQTGAFTLLAGSPAAGSPRPAPVPTFAGGLAAGGARITNVGAPTSAADATNKGYVDTNLRSAVLAHKPWAGLVLSNGVRGSQGFYSTSRIGVGTYSINFDVAALGIFVSTAQQPVWTTTPHCAGHTAAITFRSVVFGAGFKLNSFAANFEVRNGAGALADCTVSTMVVYPDSDAGSPVAPFTRQGSCVATDREVVCTDNP